MKYKHQFENVHFICSIAALKARNNGISDQNLSETTQNHARSFENNVLEHSLIAVPGYIRKKIQNSVYSPILVTSKSVGKRVCNAIRPVSG